MLMKKVFLCLLIFTLILGLVGCKEKAGSNSDLLIINDEVVSVDLFNHYLFAAKQKIKERYNIEDGSDFWEFAKIQGQNVNDYVKNQALFQIETLYITKQKLGRELTIDEQAKVERLRSLYQITYGDKYTEELAKQGLTPETNDLKLEYTAYDEIIYDKIISETDEKTFKEFYEHDMLCVKQVFVSKKDIVTNALLTDEELEQAKVKIESALYEINNAAGFSEELLKIYNEDSGIDQSGNGYLLAKTNSFFDPIWLATANSLKEGQFSGIIETDDGWHILLRNPIDINAYNDNYEDIKREFWIDLQETWRFEAKVEKNSKLWNKINVSKGLENNFGLNNLI